MAISFTGITSVNNADATTNWNNIGSGPGSGLNNDNYIEGTGAIGRKVSNSIKGMWYDNGSGIDLTNQCVAMWLNCTSVGILDTIANGGLEIRIGTTTANYNGYYVAGTDTWDGGWKMFVVRIGMTVSNTGGTGLTITSAQHFGAVWNMSATFPGNDQNANIDEMIYYPAAGITVTGTSTDFWNDLVDINDTAEHGLFTRDQGVIYSNAKIQIGGGTATDVDATGDIVVFEDPQFEDGTSEVSVHTKTSNGFTVFRDTTATDVVWGTKLAGTELGVDGVSFIAEGQEYDLTATDTDIDSYHVYGSLIRGLDHSFATSTIVSEVYSTTFDQCSRIPSSEAAFRNCVISNTTEPSTDAAMRLAPDDDAVTPNIADCLFVNNTRALIFNVTGPDTYTLDNISFEGNTTDIRNDVGANLSTINVINGGDTPTVENVGSSTNTINNTVTLTVRGATEGAQINIFTSPGGTELLDALADKNGEASTTYNYSTDQAVLVKARWSSGIGAKYLPFVGSATITSTGLDTTVVWRADPNAAVDNVLFAVDHETVDLGREYDSSVVDGGDLSITAAASQGGTTFGLQCVIDDTTAIYGEGLFVSVVDRFVRIRYKIDLNSLTMATNDQFTHCRLMANTSERLNLNLVYSGTVYQIRAQVTTDAGSSSGSVITIADAEALVEWQLVRATSATASDGSVKLWLDGVAQSISLDNLDIWDTSVPDRVRLGPSSSIDAGTSGTFYLDELIVTDGCLEIGHVIPDRGELLAAVDHDSSTTLADHYDTNANDSGDLSITTAAALNSTTNGLSINIDDANVIYGEKLFDKSWTTDTIIVKFWIDPNSLTMATSDKFTCFSLYEGVSVRFQVNFSFSAGSAYQIQMNVFHDGGSSSTSSIDLPATNDGPHYIEIIIIRASSDTASDGTVRLFFDGVDSGTSLGSLDLFDITRPDRVRMGMLGGRDAGTSGTFYMDELVIRSGPTLIGP